MKTSNIITSVIILLLIGTNLLTYCNRRVSEPLSDKTVQDTTYLHLYRKEKTEKLQLIDEYSYKLQQLSQSRDSLNFSLTINRNLLRAYRQKSADLALEVRHRFTEPKSDPTPLPNITILPVIDSILFFNEKADSACDATIIRLEESIQNRDSTIKIHGLIEGQWKDLFTEQDLQNKALENSLQTALKQQTRKARQNKVLKGALLVLSGLTTATLIHTNLH